MFGPNSTFRVRSLGSLSGDWIVIDSKSVVEISKYEDSVVSGTFDLVLTKPNTTDTLRLNSGRFDLLVSTF